MNARETIDWKLIYAFSILLILISLVGLTLQDIISPDGFVVGAGTFLLAMATFHLASNERSEGNKNREQDRYLSARERAISNYPLLSQKIDFEFPSKQLSVHGIDDPSRPHYILVIKNYGKGPAISQDKIHYIFFKGENKIHQNLIRLTGAHDIIAPEGEREVNMTVRSEGNWNLGMETKYDFIFVRLPHYDIQRNECCNCTTYKYNTQTIGELGKIERHWYLSSYPEISSERCKDCDWLAQDVTIE